jgi:hypothetical protein
MGITQNCNNDIVRMLWLICTKTMSKIFEKRENLLEK